MYRKHLSRGVAKGAMTQEEADAKYQAWIEDKEAKVAKRREATSDEISAYHTKRSGKAKAAKAKTEEPVVEPDAPEAQPAEEAQPTPEAQPAEEAQPVEEVTESTASADASTEESTPSE
jgi:small subunit ribosomal protein S16